ncbi:MAG: glutamate formimidoyltransferase [Ignavibacteria bacterium]|nr:glutamate formimidoyltransferase [Ignavibacteria bacterium]
MSKIVECVPNVSEGRDAAVIGAIRDSVTAVAGVKLISAEPDKDYNRTVVTFVGGPDAVVEAAFKVTETAAKLIDMTKHKGEHPRMGATDVVPFVPVSGVTMEECAELARRYGARVGKELGIPVFLYEEAASTPERSNLSNVRKGEYEGLKQKLAQAEWKPDFGKAEFNPKSGATAAGARMFLIAYNVNLKTNDTELANRIALSVRESGQLKRDADGKPVLDAEGKKVKIPGTLKSVKAMGVLLETHDIAQVSMNLVNYHVTPPHVAFEEVRRQGKELGIEVTGSEIVGVTPKEALLMAGKFYTPGTEDEEKLLSAAVDHLGLSQLEPFDLRKKVIEFQL